MPALPRINWKKTALGLYGPLHDSISAEGGGERVLRLMRALELPTVRLSLFHNEAEVGPPGESTQELAGRFGGIYRTLVAARKPQRGDGSIESNAGLYDMFSRTEVLTRPVQLVRLFRDGTLSSEATTARVTELLWRDVDEPECEGWKPGFGFGDVDGPIWRYFSEPGNELAQPVKPASGPARLFAYHALQAPTRTKAQRSEQVVKLDLTATGFARWLGPGVNRSAGRILWPLRIVP